MEPEQKLNSLYPAFLLWNAGYFLAKESNVDNSPLKLINTYAKMAIIGKSWLRCRTLRNPGPVSGNNLERRTST